jgi:hypothetical protein
LSASERCVSESASERSQSERGSLSISERCVSESANTLRRVRVRDGWVVRLLVRGVFRPAPL